MTKKKSKQSSIKPPQKSLFERVSSILEQAQTNVVRSVNSETVIAYWLIGREIVQDLQSGDERAEYGKRLINELADLLNEKFSKGFSSTNLWYFRQFYLTFTDRKPEILHTMGGELGSPKGFHPNLSWSHYRTLMKVEKLDVRDFYETEAVRCGWNKRELERQISTLFFERLLISKDKQGMLLDAKKEDNAIKPVDVLKDPYILEFLDLPNEAKLYEMDLESSIIDKLQHFL